MKTGERAFFRLRGRISCGSAQVNNHAVYMRALCAPEVGF